MATGVTVGYNFRLVSQNAAEISELKSAPAADHSVYLTLAQFNEFKDAQVADRQWMVDALYNLHIKFDAFLMGYQNTVPPPDHPHPDDYDPGAIKRMMADESSKRIRP